MEIMDSLKSIKKALTHFLHNWPSSAISSYQLGLALHRIIQKEITANNPDSRIYKEVISSCLEDGILISNQNVSIKDLFFILGKHAENPKQIACASDPFCYISHLSAMEYHGLTDRFAAIIHATTLPKNEWKKKAENQMRADLLETHDNYTKALFPPLRPIQINKIGKQHIEIHTAKDFGPFKHIKDQSLRIATIGRTFLDMLRNPEFCGGMNHVLDIYQESSERYLENIAETIGRHGKKIEKIRAGFLLEEWLNFKHPTIEDWLKLVQRGGSRKLDPKEEYSEQCSKKWHLSINVPGIER